MNTIFCNKCGQANLPNSNYCAKCNNNLGKVEKRETVNFKTKNNNKIYWIAGGVSFLLIISFFTVSILGAGTYLYFSNIRKPPIEQRKTDQNEKKRNETDTKSKDDVLIKMTNDDVQSYIKDELFKVGKYKLVKTGTPKPFFNGAKTEQFGLYNPEDNKDEIVLLIIATFPTVSDSKDFFENKIDEIKRNGGEVRLRKNKGETDWLIYTTKEAGVQLMKCRKGICVNVQATTGKDAADFFESYENITTN